MYSLKRGIRIDINCRKFISSRFLKSIFGMNNEREVQSEFQMYVSVLPNEYDFYSKNCNTGNNCIV